MTTSYPPHVLHASAPVSPKEALELLQNYLSDCETQAWLHPDAILTESGPQVAQTMAGGFTLHNLRRVEAGLRGERLGTDVSLDGFTATEQIQLGYNGMLPAPAGEGDAGNHMAGEGEWQDMDTFRRNQDIAEGEIEQRDTGIEDAGEVPRLVDGRADKEARKKAKLERRKEEKRLRSEARQREKLKG